MSDLQQIKIDRIRKILQDLCGTEYDFDDEIIAILETCMESIGLREAGSTPFDDHAMIADTLNKMGWRSTSDAQWDHLREWCEAMRQQWLAATPAAHLEGFWPAYDLRRAFVEGAKWWEWESRMATMWQSDRNKAEAEAERRYGALAAPEERHE